MRTRLASLSEISVLQDVEDDAAELFERLPEFAFVMNYPAREASEYEAAVAASRAFVVEVDSVVAGFVLMGAVDGQGHIWELSVRMKCQRQGVGKRLIDAGCQWAGGQGFVEVTLTTFRHAPWNAPAYSRMGFETFIPDDKRPALSGILEHERSIGLCRVERVAMRRMIA